MYLQDFQFGLRGLGLRHVTDFDFPSPEPSKPAATAAAANDDNDNDSRGGGRGDRIPFPFTFTLPPSVSHTMARWSPVEVRSGVSVKRLPGVAVPQLWRMGRVGGRAWV